MNTHTQKIRLTEGQHDCIHHRFVLHQDGMAYAAFDDTLSGCEVTMGRKQPGIDHNRLDEALRYLHPMIPGIDVKKTTTVNISKIPEHLHPAAQFILMDCVLGSTYWCAYQSETGADFSHHLWTLENKVESLAWVPWTQPWFIDPTGERGGSTKPFGSRGFKDRRGRLVENTREEREKLAAWNKGAYSTIGPNHRHARGLLGIDPELEV